MRVPKARKLASGSWFIQLRLGGQSIPVTAATQKQCVADAALIKSAYLAEKRLPERTQEKTDDITLKTALDAYIEAKKGVLSPATIRGYRNIQKYRFKEIMGSDVYELAKLSKQEWQKIVSRESKNCAPKTLKSSYSLIKTVLQEQTMTMLPKITLPAAVPHDVNFLTADEIPIFVEAVSKTDVAIPALLALSSMRLSEIQALDWKDIKPDPEFIRVKGAIVPGEDHKLRRKEQNKNATSARYVPIMIPALKAALKAERKQSGPVMECSRSHLLKMVHKVCQQAKITDVTIHGLRHSFASLAYKLQIPEKAAMQIGGWADTGTMHKIYTHIAQQDIAQYSGAMADFYSQKPQKKKKNANKNANKKK